MFRVRKRDMPGLAVLREDLFVQEERDREVLDYLIQSGVLKVVGEEKGKRFIGWAEPLDTLRQKFPEYAREFRE